MSFNFRADTATPILRYDIFDSKVRASSSATSQTSWRVVAYGGKWYASDGADTLRDTTLAFAAGTTYSFDITQDPAHLSWGLTITDGTTTKSIADLDTRTSTWGTDVAPQLGARWLTFGASEIIDGTSVGTTARFSVDSIKKKTDIPEPNAISLIFGSLALVPVILRRRK